MRLVFLFTLSLSILLGCTSSQDVLTPVDSTPSNVAEETLGGPLYRSLRDQLVALQYEGIGLQYETDSTLQLLQRVFSDPRTQNRQVGPIYTGLALSYDAQFKSLTVGGAKDPEAIIRYIEKNIPVRSLAKPSAPAVQSTQPK